MARDNIPMAARAVHNGRTWEYRLIFLVSYFFMLVAELVDRSLHVFATAGSRGRKSVLSAARENAHIAATHAFLG